MRRHIYEAGISRNGGGAKVTALAANHAMPENEQALHYVIEKDGKKLFYGCDGGWFRDITWASFAIRFWIV